MSGSVEGADGSCSYTGENLKYTDSTTTAIEALYFNFSGAKHTFAALVHVEQTGIDAVISGVVTEGWRKGN